MQEKCEGFLYPLDENGERRHYKNVQRPKEVEPYIWYGLKFAEEEKMAEEYRKARAPEPPPPEPADSGAPLAFAPLGWDNIMVAGASGPDLAQIEHVPVVAADVDIDHVAMVGHAMVDRPPWEQFDLDANDYLVDSNLVYWNDVDGPRQRSFATAGVSPAAASKPEEKCGGDPASSTQNYKCWEVSA